MSGKFESIRPGAGELVALQIKSLGNLRVVYKPTFNQTISEFFTTNIGVPQGDALSPLLFYVYLQAEFQAICNGPRYITEHDCICGRL